MRALRSGDDVRRQLVLQPGKPVAQQELALFQPLQLQLIHLPGVAQRLDRRVQIPMFLAQPFHLGDEGGAFLWREPLVVHVYTALPLGRSAQAQLHMTMDAPGLPRKTAAGLATDRSGEGELAQIAFDFTQCQRPLPPKCWGWDAGFERARDILRLARTASYVTISSS